MAVSVSMLSRAVARSVDLVLALAMAEALPISGWLGGMLFLLVSDGVRGGQSPGKRLMRLRVVGREGADCSLEESMTRNLDLALALLLWKLPIVGWLLLAGVIAAEGVMVIGSAEGMRFGDELARTRVVPSDWSGEAATVPETAESEAGPESAVASADAESGSAFGDVAAGNVVAGDVVAGYVVDSKESSINKEESGH